METTASPPVEHRLLGLDRRLIGPTLGVLFVILLWSIILPRIAGSISYDGTVAAGTTVEVGAGVTFAPATGWELSGDGQEGTGLIEVHHSGVSFTIRTGSFDGELPEFMDAVTKTEDIAAIAGSQSTTVTAAGVAGLSEPFEGPNQHGEIVVFAQDGVGVEVVVVAPTPGASSFGPEIDQMISSITFPKEQS